MSCPAARGNTVGHWTQKAFLLPTELPVQCGVEAVKPESCGSLVKAPISFPGSCYSHAEGTPRWL